jgi:hypothetical protein
MPVDAATTARFAVANELLAFATKLLSNFTRREVVVRLERLLKGTKPSVGFYPSALRNQVQGLWLEV